MAGVLLSLSLAASPAVLGVSLAGPGSGELRAADEPRPQRRSRDREHAMPRLTMGAGPTAIAMLVFLAAVVARGARRRRASVHEG
ncbi:MAG: hypothetical protein H6712_29225 [Myxococcales bacterium]|nr:hypothetical protein [Myxococcales bacterium]MCB9717967.1 hypothetical protein [Myxococcales bacterium]